MRPAPFLTFLFLGSGCTTFSTVRSAAVVPGPSIAGVASTSTTSGDEVGWLHGYDCASSCSRAIPAVEMGASFGNTSIAAPIALGFGLSGTNPYVEFYT